MQKSEISNELRRHGWMFDSGYWISPVDLTACETLDEALTLHCSYLAEGWYIQKKQKEPKTNDSKLKAIDKKTNDSKLKAIDKKTNDSKLKAIDKVLNENYWNLNACIKIREILDGKL